MSSVAWTSASRMHGTLRMYHVWDVRHRSEIQAAKHATDTIIPKTTSTPCDDNGKVRKVAGTTSTVILTRGGSHKGGGGGGRPKLTSTTQFRGPTNPYDKSIHHVVPRWTKGQ